MKPGPFSNRAFSLTELLVAVAVLTLLLILMTQLFNGAVAATGYGSKHMDADSQARAVFERMAIDFTQMVRRPDVDYFLKDSVNLQPGNDQLAFFSKVQGYHSAGTPAADRNPVSLIGYRLNSDTSSPSLNKLERLGYGLLWNGTPPDSMVFSSRSISSGPSTILANWPFATTMAADPNYDTIGPQVFRMEYFYVLKSQRLPNGVTLDSCLSSVPWDERITNIPGLADHTGVEGLQDVAAIAVVLAVLDSGTKVIVPNSQLSQIGQEMGDFSSTASGGGPASQGELEAQWEADYRNAGLPVAVTSAIRIYSRYFYLTSTNGLSSP